MFGGINGGVNAGLLDSVTYWCLLCCMPEDVGYTTIDLTVNDMHSAQSGIIYAEGEVIKHGRTISLTEGRITDEKGTLIAYGTSKLFASPTIQPMSLAAEYLGIGTMPPKFIDYFVNQFALSSAWARLRFDSLGALNNARQFLPCAQASVPCLLRLNSSCIER